VRFLDFVNLLLYKWSGSGYACFTRLYIYLLHGNEGWSIHENRMRP